MLTSTMQGSFASTVAAALLIMCACGGAFAAGVPLLVMPAPLVAASGLVLWFESGQLRDYAIFFAGTILTSAWFLHHHFWFLEVRLSTSVCHGSGHTATSSSLEADCGSHL